MSITVDQAVKSETVGCIFFGFWRKKPLRSRKKMSIGEEMTKDDVLNTIATFHKVRMGGPKEKRLRRVELMGEHTPKPLHWLKVTLPENAVPIPLETLLAVFETIADVGDIYRPCDPETKGPREFVLVGYYSAVDIDPAVRKLNGIEVDGVKLDVEPAKHWFMSLYPFTTAKERLTTRTFAGKGVHKS